MVLCNICLLINVLGNIVGGSLEWIVFVMCYIVVDVNGDVIVFYDVWSCVVVDV